MIPLIFDAKKAYRLREPIYWSVVPLSYFAFALLNGFGSETPNPRCQRYPLRLLLCQCPINLVWNKGLGKCLVINCRVYRCRLSLVPLRKNLLVITQHKIQTELPNGTQFFYCNKPNFSKSLSRPSSSNIVCYKVLP